MKGDKSNSFSDPTNSIQQRSILCSPLGKRERTIDDLTTNPLGMHNIIFTKEGPRAAKDVELPLNSTHKSWQTPRDYLQSFAPSYQEENKWWIVSLLDGVGGVTKAVAFITLHGQPYNVIAVEKDKDQWEACATSINDFIAKENAKVFFISYFTL